MTEPTKQTVTLYMGADVAADSAGSELMARVMEDFYERAMHPERHYHGPSSWVDEIEHAKIDDVRIVTPGHHFRVLEKPVAKVCIATGYECEDIDLTAGECRTEAAKLIAAADILDDLA